MAKAFGTCTYCLRPLAGARSRCGTAATRDHVMPKCVGGTRKVPCCATCNGLKGDIHPSVWRWFTETHPRWWHDFRTNREVVDACRDTWGSMVRVSVTGRAPRSDFEGRAEPSPHAT